MGSSEEGGVGRKELEKCLGSTAGNRPLSRGGHFESQGNKKLCFCTYSLALDERLDVQNLLFEHCVIKVYTCYCSHQRFDIQTMGKGQFCLILILSPCACVCLLKQKNILP